MKKDKRKVRTTEKLTEKFIAEAKQRNDSIQTDLAELNQRWMQLGKACVHFKKYKYFRAITDPRSKQRFKTFTAWAKWVSGKSKSTVFSIVRIVRELEGDIPEEDLAQTSKENSEALIEIKKKRGRIEREEVEAAKNLTSREFRKRYVLEGTQASEGNGDHSSKKAGDETQPRSPLSQRSIGPFAVSAPTAELFQQALDVALEQVSSEGVGSSETALDAALAMIASEFIDSRELEQALDRKPPAAVAREGKAGAEEDIA